MILVTQPASASACIASTMPCQIDCAEYSVSTMPPISDVAPPTRGSAGRSAARRGPRTADRTSRRYGSATSPAAAPASSATAELNDDTRQVVDVVRRAVDRVDQPGRRRAVATGDAVLLAVDPMLGKPLRDRVAHEPLDREVGLGHPVGRRLLGRDLIGARPLGDDPLHRAHARRSSISAAHASSSASVSIAPPPAGRRARDTRFVTTASTPQSTTRRISRGSSTVHVDTLYPRSCIAVDDLPRRARSHGGLKYSTPSSSSSAAGGGSRSVQVSAIRAAGASARIAAVAVDVAAREEHAVERSGARIAASAGSTTSASVKSTITGSSIARERLLERQRDPPARAARPASQSATASARAPDAFERRIVHDDDAVRPPSA